MPRIYDPEKGHFLKVSLKDWFASEEASTILRDCGKIGLPTTHITGKKPNAMSGFILPYDDGDSRYKKVFYDHTWLLLCAKASASHFNHGLLWITNEQEKP